MAAVPPAIRRRGWSIALLAALAMGAVTVLTGFDAVGFVTRIPNRVLGLFGAFGVLGVLVVLTAIVIVAGTLEEFGMAGSTAVAIGNVIRAAAVVLALGIVAQNPSQFADELRRWWFVVPLAILGYFLFVYFQNRAETAKPTTALRRTRRALSQDVERSTQFAVGSVVLAVTLVLAALSGALQAVGGVGTALLQFAGEAAYVFTAFLGCRSLGGCAQLGFLPQLAPNQWLAIVFGIGAIALFIREEK